MGLDTVELLMAVEETFQISFSNEEAAKICTVGDFYDGILKKLEAPSSNNPLSNIPQKKHWNKDEVWEGLRSVIVHQLGVKPEEVIKEARIVRDLGAD